MQQYKNNCMEVGLDEAGRGPLIGRVYAGAVIWSETNTIVINNSINDSKKLTPKKRAVALDWIYKNIKYWGVGYADEKEIDKINILNATKLAMDRAIKNIIEKNPHLVIKDLVIDGTGWDNKFNYYNVSSVIKGDSIYYSIAAASIIAKESHDKHIRELITIDPTLDTKYGLSSNMGYPTKKHIEGVEKYGGSVYHRYSFAPLKKNEY
jgi:ribonuclease HII